MKYKNIIFDLDGVLVFTDEYHYVAWKAVADSIGIALDETINNRLRGVSRMESLEIILSYSDCKFTDAEKRTFALDKNEIYKGYLNNLKPESISSETLQMLDTLKAMGKKMAIGSSSKNAEFILDKTDITHYFSAIVGGNSITKTKPDPEVFLLAAKLLSSDSKDCLVVEDAHAGIEAACAGGFDCVGIGDAYNSNFATYRVKNISEILDIV